METVDRFSAVTLHQQLAAILRRAIETGELAPRDRLPSEPELMSIHSVSRGTVRVAIRQLRDEGLVVAFGGRGTFVADQRGEPGT